MRIILFPIEPLEARYSAQWLKWFPREFKNHGIDYLIIDPTPLSTEIREGTFLDVCGTNYYKAKQLSVFCEKAYHGDVKDGDIIFIEDLWYPGLEMLSYIRDGMGIDFKIVGCLHAGTYDSYDFVTKMRYWGKPLEESWFRIIDLIFVGSEHHKRILMERREVDERKIKVTGFPLYWEGKNISYDQKEKIIVFPHRLTEDKNSHLFDLMEKELHQFLPDFEFVKTQSIRRSKKEYYDLLAKSRICVSFADHEYWGIAVQESLFSNCFVVVPYKLSYIELYNPIFTYGSFLEACNLLVTIERNPHLFEQYRDADRVRLLERGEQAIPKMIQEMSKL